MYRIDPSLELQHLAPVSDSIHGCMLDTLEIARRIGFDALIYDFTPVPTTPEGVLMTPSVIEPCNLPAEMRDLWVRQGLYQKDPVQALALKGSCPFFWSYHKNEASVLQHRLDESTAAVSSVLHDWRYSRGVTVPLHMLGNRFATMTALWHDQSYSAVQDSLDLSVMRLAYLAHAANDRLSTLFGRQELTPVGVRLSARERECIVLAAQGMSTKQIAWKLNRSESTIVLHLQSAARKLGGRNRAQAIARAAHFGYLRDRVD
jgi:LuxR family transcriptional regulator, quorum-sensing system regulator SdiA